MSTQIAELMTSNDSFLDEECAKPCELDDEQMSCVSYRNASASAYLVTIKVDETMIFGQDNLDQDMK